MKKSEIFLKAAERIERGKDIFACCAIDNIQRADWGRIWSDNAQWYQRKMLPRNSIFPYSRTSRGLYIEPGPDQKNARIVALCFAAAIAEDEE